jgi:hypothetical protein
MRQQICHAIAEAVREATPRVPRIGRKPGLVLQDYASVVEEARGEAAATPWCAGSFQHCGRFPINVAVCTRPKGTALVGASQHAESGADGLSHLYLYTNELMRGTSPLRARPGTEYERRDKGSARLHVQTVHTTPNRAFEGTCRFVASTGGRWRHALNWSCGAREATGKIGSTHWLGNDRWRPAVQVKP